MSELIPNTIYLQEPSYTPEVRNPLRTNLSAGNYKITNLQNPTDNQDVANKQYVDQQITNVNTQRSAVVVSTSTGTPYILPTNYAANVYLNVVDANAQLHIPVDNDNALLQYIQINNNDCVLLASIGGVPTAQSRIYKVHNHTLGSLTNQLTLTANSMWRIISIKPSGISVGVNLYVEEVYS